MIRSFFIRTLIITLSSVTFFSVAFAQVDIPANQFVLPGAPDQSSITLHSTNDHPHPYQQIMLSVDSYSIDITSAKIVWKINGKVVDSGIGVTSHALTLGPVGTKATVAVTATINGVTYTDSATYVAASVDLLWQAHAYTPLFYDGKARLPNQGDVTIVAIPQFDDKGVPASSNDYIYTWKKDGQVLGDASGHGHDSITLAGSLLVRPTQVSVIVSTTDGKISATGNVLIQSESPEIVIYEDNQLYGTILNHPLGSSFALKDKELHLRALPFYFSTNNYHAVAPLTFSWTVNDSNPIVKSDETIALRQPDSKTKGQSSLTIEVKNPNRILQLANSNTTVSFNTTQ